MTKGNGFTCRFVVEKATPGTIRYMEVDGNGQRLKTADGAKIGTLYVRKDALGSDVPGALEVAFKAV